MNRLVANEYNIRIYSLLEIVLKIGQKAKTLGSNYSEFWKNMFQDLKFVP